MCSYVVRGVSMYFVYIEGISMFPMDSSMITRSLRLTLKACVQVGVSQGISHGIPSRFITIQLSRYIFRVALFSPGQPAASFSEFLWRAGSVAGGNS